MIQGGPLPCFMEEGQLQRLLQEDSTLTEAENQFQSALAEFGLIEVNISTTLFRKWSGLIITQVMYCTTS